jgi:hypothetical protein
MGLEGIHKSYGSAQIHTPQDTFASVTLAAEIKGIHHLGTILSDHIRVASKAIASQDNFFSTNPFYMVTMFNHDTVNDVFSIGHQVGRGGIGYDLG